MSGYTCSVCEFTLWNPVGELGVSFLGIYNDDRFPGRCLLVLREHVEHWEDVGEALLNAFVADSKRAILAIRSVTGSERVNLAVLGNDESHVHFHLIPRFLGEALPKKSPWNDPRPLAHLGEERLGALARALAQELGKASRPG